MKKIVLSLLLLTGLVFSQTWTVKKLSYDAVAGVSFSGSNIDSSGLVTGTRSTEKDASLLGTGGNTIWFAMSLDGNSTSDTLLVWLQGYDELTGNWVSIDTLSSGLVSTAAGTTTTTGTLSLSGYFPTWAVFLKQKSTSTDPSDDEVFKLSLFAVPPTLPERSYWK